MADPKEALHAILNLLKHGDPLRLRKVQLLDQRSEVIRIALAGIEGEPLPPPQTMPPSEEAILAMELVVSYQGTNNFMQDLRVSLATYGSLTVRQVAAVLSHPYPREIAQMEMEGVDPRSVTYRWQAFDALNEARGRLA